MATLIKGGTVVSATGADRAEVLIDGERVEAVLRPGSDIAVTAEATAEVIDASDRLVVPGGVDVHTHMDIPIMGTRSSDDFETGTRAAAWGGTTTIVDFATQNHGENVRECLEQRLAQADGSVTMLRGFASERTLWLSDVFAPVPAVPLGAPDGLTGDIDDDRGIDVSTNSDRAAQDRLNLDVMLGRQGAPSLQAVNPPLPGPL